MPTRFHLLHALRAPGRLVRDRKDELNVSLDSDPGVVLGGQIENTVTVEHQSRYDSFEGTLNNRCRRPWCYRLGLLHASCLERRVTSQHSYKGACERGKKEIGLRISLSVYAS